MQKLYEDQATWWAVPQTNLFLDQLAALIQVNASNARLNAYQTLVILPTRRNGRKLRQALLKASHDRVIITPHITTLSDITSLPFLIDQNVIWNEWQCTAHLINIITPHLPTVTPLATVMHYAKKLYGLLQEWQHHQLTVHNLETLSPEHFAEHFQANMTLFRVALEQFPIQHLAATQQHQTSIRLLREYPDMHLLIATESPQDAQTIELLNECHRRPHTDIFLIGFDPQFIHGDYPQLQPYHPYYGFKRLLTAADINLDNQQTMDAVLEPVTLSARRQLLTRIYNDDRLTHPDIAACLDAGALYAVDMIQSTTLQDEALSLAIILRESLETPEQRTALITPDRALVELVIGQLRRWEINIEDSAGEAMFLTPTGSFLKLTIECVFNSFKPISFLALLKHPYFACQQAPVKIRQLARLFEKKILRQSEPMIHNWQTWRQQIDDQSLLDLFEHIQTLSVDIQALIRQNSLSLTVLLTAHLKLALALATSDEKSGHQVLFGNETGDSIFKIIQDLLLIASEYPPINGADYPELFGYFLHGVHVRKTYGYHPRLMILDPLQAQLQDFDCVILAGLNANTWPQSNTINDPWFSQEMRRACGLPMLTHQNGSALHNFLTLFNSQRVILSRAQKAGGVLTLPSPWLQRLQTALKAHQSSNKADNVFTKIHTWQAWQQQLDDVDTYQPLIRPRPRPLLNLRPQTLSVTSIEKLMNDPYAVFAQKILHLRELPDLESEPAAAFFGTLVHQVLDKFFSARLPSMANLIQHGTRLFAPLKYHVPIFYGIYWSKFLNLAPWIYQQYQLDQAHIVKTFTEVKGYYDVPLCSGTFRLTAIADRIDVMVDGTLRIIDYKTGLLPTLKQIQQGLRPQLLLEAIIAEKGQFNSVTPAPVSILEYWQLGRHIDGGERLSLVQDIYDCTAKMHDQLITVIEHYQQSDSYYQPAWQTHKFCPYNHLARRNEWSMNIL